MDNIFSILRSQEQVYTSEKTKLGKYVEWSMYETVQTITAYLNSTHISGKIDSLGREKPFFNICSATTNIWYRATDLDRKNVVILPSESQQVAMAFVATALLQDWMIKEKFGHFLNDWGRTLARYGSAVVKFVEKEGRLIPSVVSWDNLIVDAVDFNANPVIEKFYLTPAQLKSNKNYDKETVKALLGARMARENLEGHTIDTNANYIEVYEIHGNLPLSLLTDREEDADIYVQQMHVVSYMETDKEDEYVDFSLFRGRERSPYMITHLIEEPGRTLAIGAVEYLFDAQWMVNHTMKQMKDYLELASKLIFQTADQRFAGRNVLTAIETGDILQHQINMPITQVSNVAINITALQNYSAQWRSLSQEITSTPDASRGLTPPSGTPFSTVATLVGQANSLFEIMTENKGLYLEDMLREFVIPHLKKKMDTSEEITAILDDKGIAEIDAMFVPREAIRRHNRNFAQKVIAGEEPEPFNQAEMEADVRRDLSSTGNMRFIRPGDVPTKTWKEVLKDLEWKVKVNITDEMEDKQAVMTALSSVFQTIASNPAILENPNGKMLFNKILQNSAVVSPIEMSAMSIPSPMQPLPSVGGDVKNLLKVSTEV